VTGKTTRGGGNKTKKKKNSFFLNYYYFKIRTHTGAEEKNLDVDVLAHPCDVRGSAVYL
jgi:hypothetical protein